MLSATTAENPDLNACQPGICRQLRGRFYSHGCFTDGRADGCQIVNIAVSAGCRGSEIGSGSGEYLETPPGMQSYPVGCISFDERIRVLYSWRLS